MGHLLVVMATVLVGVSAFGTAVGAGLWWLWSRAKASGWAEGRLEAERHVQSEAQEKLNKMIARQAELEREIERLRRRRGL